MDAWRRPDQTIEPGAGAPDRPGDVESSASPAMPAAPGDTAASGPSTGAAGGSQQHEWASTSPAESFEWGHTTELAGAAWPAWGDQQAPQQSAPSPVDWVPAHTPSQPSDWGPPQPPSQPSDWGPPRPAQPDAWSGPLGQPGTWGTSTQPAFDGAPYPAPALGTVGRLPSTRRDEPRRRLGWVSIGAISIVSALLASVVTVAALGKPAIVPAPTPAPVPVASAPVATAALPTQSAGRTAAVPAPPGGVIDVVEAVQRTSPSVVTITITGQGRTVRGAGAASDSISGLVVSKDGLILTAWHLVVAATGLNVSLPDGRTLAARVVASDRDHDLAVVRVDATDLSAVGLASASKLRIGQTLLAMGGPLEGGSGSVSSGILSATNRSQTLTDPQSGDDLKLSGLIQTDAAISVDNVGGPITDAGGDVVGIALAAADRSQGIGFAEPIDVANTVIAQAQSAR